MYTAPNESTLYGTRRYGQVVTDPTGNTVGGWRTLSGGPTRPFDRCGR
ncbi:hypothetical protein GA0070216_12066 [Micromonospora matsumotoense]|uniref:Uncharacterized protein n=1 Tax=Micromonospora matsumotoense TaxID=121616 RepID=A0A1C5ANQ1_9ACTN|nr:hypothetical protein GA0070216_12066 [Micromonospora matsumotoense]